MDIEQLKLVLDLARGAGQGAVLIAILYICKGYFVTVAWIGFLTFAVSLVGRLIKEAVDKQQLMRRVADEFGIYLRDVNTEVHFLNSLRERINR